MPSECLHYRPKSRKVENIQYLFLLDSSIGRPSWSGWQETTESFFSHIMMLWVHKEKVLRVMAVGK